MHQHLIVFYWFHHKIKSVLLHFLLLLRLFCFLRSCWCRVRNHMRNEYMKRIKIACNTQIYYGETSVDSALAMACGKTYKRSERINRWENYSNINYCGNERVSKKCARSFWKLVNQLHSLSAHRQLSPPSTVSLPCSLSLPLARLLACCGVFSLCVRQWAYVYMFIMYMIVHVAALKRKIA